MKHFPPGGSEKSTTSVLKKGCSCKASWCGFSAQESRTLSGSVGSPLRSMVATACLVVAMAVAGEPHQPPQRHFGEGAAMKVTGWVNGLPTDANASGFVLPLTLDRAVTGWVVDLNNPMAKLRIDFALGGRHVGSANVTGKLKLYPWAHSVSPRHKVDRSRSRSVVTLTTRTSTLSNAAYIALCSNADKHTGARSIVRM